MRLGAPVSISARFILHPPYQHADMEIGAPGFVGEATEGDFSFPFQPYFFNTPVLHVTMNRAVFLDRDGTVIEDKHYLHRPEEVVIYPGAIAALCRLQTVGFKLFIVSNQSGVGRGYFTLADVEKVNTHLCNELRRQGVGFDEIYIAPEAPNTPSRGRKPSPQFLFDARQSFGVDLRKSYMIGDKLIDLECGWNAGVRKSILVRTGYGAELEQESGPKLARAVVVKDLPAAVDWIIRDMREAG
jgi:D-glycero-D-manno-heptose 1,7-bisphosphate phosphatase